MDGTFLLHIELAYTGNDRVEKLSGLFSTKAVVSTIAVVCCNHGTQHISSIAVIKRLKLHHIEQKFDVPIT